MEKFQEAIEEVQLSVMDILNNIILLADSKKRTPEENLKLISQYAKEQHSIICEDIAIHEDKIKELAVPQKHTSSTN
ncbi:MAG: hypothetical protein U0O04_00010 [Clostridia bacterium]